MIVSSDKIDNNFYITKYVMDINQRMWKPWKVN
jgi:hypothetical protein